MVVILILLVVWSCFGALATAEQAKTRIYVEAKTLDTVGQLLLHNIQERIRSSGRYALAAAETDAWFHLRIVTLSPNGDNAGHSTMYSVVLTGTQPVPPFGTMYLDNWVGTCGSQRASECAGRLVADIDSDLAVLLKAAATAAKTTHYK